MSAPSTHVITKSCNLLQQIGTNGFIPSVGVVSSTHASFWFTNQSAFLWINSANYSTVSVSGYSDLSALFDEVKIAAIEITIICGNDPTTGGTGSCSLGMANDYNDKNAPAALADIQQYADFRIVNLSNNRPTYREVLVPKFLTYSLDSAGTAIASSPKTGYIRSNLDIEHFGIKMSLLSAPPNTVNVTINFKYKFICKVQK